MSYKRNPKNYLINPKKQFLYAFFAVVPIFLAIGFQSLLILKKIREMKQDDDLIFSGKELELVQYIFSSAGLTFLMVGLFTFLLSILVTHRIFGSLFSIEKHFHDLIENKERGPITYRKLDGTESLVKVLNQYLEKNKDQK